MVYNRLQFLAVVLTGIGLAGCSSSGFKDVVGMGKYSPDETQVRANQALSMPPSLQLPAPSGTEPAAAPAPDQPSDLLATQKVTPAPPQYGAPDPNEAPPIAAVEPQQTIAATAPQPVIVDPPAPDIYDKLGISKVHPDGRPKSKAELINELRKKRIEEKRKENPNYGSVFNSGGIWSDNIFGD